MVRLYDYLPSGNGYKIRLLLTQLGIPFERVEVDILKGESRTAEFLARNPNGKIPVVELEEETFLAESNAILFYFATDTPYLPRERLEQAAVLQWMFFEQYSHEPNIATVRFWLQHLGLNDERRAVLESKRRAGYDALRVMDRRLQSAPFFVGGRYTIADIALYAYTHVADEGGFDLAGFTAVREWMERVRSEPRHLTITDATVGSAI